MALKVSCISVGPIATNCYIVSSAQGCLVIDPGAESARILDALNGQTPLALVATHGHWDHIGALGEMADKTGAPVMAFAGTPDLLHDRRLNGMAANWPDAEIPPVARGLRDGDAVELAGMRLEVIHTPGHTCDSICLYERGEGLLFAGDTLFAGGGVGRCDLPTGSQHDMARSCHAKLAGLPDNVTVYSGHGPSSTMGYERLINPLLQA